MNGKNIILNDSAKIDLTCQGSLNDILIVGNFNGMFGRINESGLDLSGEPSEEIINNFMWLNDTCRDAKKVFIGTRSSVGDYVKNMMAAAENLGIQINRDKYNIILVDSDDELLNKLNEISHTMPKFDYIIQNPPYAKTLHIDFFKKGIELLNDTGKMTIIEPATWLINIRKDGNAKRIYNPLKEMIKNKIEKITIDNLNSMFATKIFGLFSILKFDNSKNESSFILDICGNKSYVNDIYAVNLAGANVDEIMKKVISFKEHINKHFNAVKNDYSYVKANEFVLGFNDGYDTKTNIVSINGIDYYSLCVCGSIHHSDQKIYDDVPLNKRNKLCDVIGGTREELENYLLLCKSKLNIFLNVLLYTDQRNHVMKYVPWLVDKQYTDQEIYEMFHFTEQEINLIEYTVEKFQYSSPFFKRYMCGPSKVSDQEVQDYIESLKKKHNIDY